MFVGLAWLLTAPAMGVLIGKVVSAADRRAGPAARFSALEADLRTAARRPAAGHR